MIRAHDIPQGSQVGDIIFVELVEGFRRTTWHIKHSRIEDFSTNINMWLAEAIYDLRDKKD